MEASRGPPPTAGAVGNDRASALLPRVRPDYAAIAGAHSIAVSSPPGRHL